jgi:hypothetical protein
MPHARWLKEPPCTVSRPLLTAIRAATRSSHCYLLDSRAIHSLCERDKVDQIAVTGYPLQLENDRNGHIHRLILQAGYSAPPCAGSSCTNARTRTLVSTARTRSFLVVCHPHVFQRYARTGIPQDRLDLGQLGRVLGRRWCDARTKALSARRAPRQRDTLRCRRYRRW